MSTHLLSTMKEAVENSLRSQPWLYRSWVVLLYSPRPSLLRELSSSVSRLAQKLVERRRVKKRHAGARDGKRASRPVDSTTRKTAEILVGDRTRDDSFSIAGVGASAGGLEAFTQLLQELPSTINMALVLVQHLDPTYKSLLTELLSRTTKLAVEEVTDGTRVKPGHVYVIPPNTKMTISKRVLHLTPRNEVDRRHTPIDGFLESLALDQKSRAIGIILSGTSMDGIHGLRAIKDEGGITIAQDEKSAKYYDLPRSAVAAGCVDLILRPQDIAQELVKLSQHPYVPYLETETAEKLLPQSDLDKIFSLLRKATGVDFADYKHATIKRRILRRMLILKTNKMEDYLNILKTNPGELSSLFQDILINVTGLEKARDGVYAASASISAERLRRFFAKTNGSYQVNKTIRRMCVFAKQDVTADPPFSKLDLIICRNLLIYLGPPLQKKLLPIFHYSLKPAGFLVLGDFETVGEFDNIFKVANKRFKIFSKRPVVTRRPLDFSTTYIAKRQVGKPEVNRLAESQVPEPEIFKEADRILLTKYTPASVIVNSELEIIQFRGRTGYFLEPAPGKASLNVLKMAREGMMTDLRNAIDRAKRSGEIVRKEAIAIRSDGKYLDVNLEVVPLKTNRVHPCFLVAFEEALPKPAPSVTLRRAGGDKSKKERRAEDLKLVRLQQELSATKDYLQSIIEDKEAANEELKAANEEIQSSNEELQSTNEELETAKEELQSTNEELTTVNEELQNRNLELTQVNNDMTNLNASANVPVLMTGSDLRLRRWGPLADKLFNLKASDLGRPIFDVNLGFQIPDLKETINEVVDNVVSKEIEAKGPQGRWFLVRIGPYRTADNRIEGAVLAFVDIDRLKQGEAKLRARSEHLEDLVEERSRMLSNTTRLAAIGETAGMVGHDLRNPLQTIINTIHLAKEAMKANSTSTPEKDPRVGSALETIREQADFMNKIVSDLQDYAKQAKPTFVQYDMQRLIDDSLSSIPVPKSVEVLSSVETGFPKLSVDPGLLRRAFTNIITNALQAMPDGGKLKISAWTNQNIAAVSFQDTGIGIPEDVKAKMFSPLFTTREKGVGLGLAVTKRLIESHKGEIKVFSKVGEGTTLTVELPIDLRR